MQVFLLFSVTALMVPLLTLYVTEQETCIHSGLLADLTVYRGFRQSVKANADHDLLLPNPYLFTIHHASMSVDTT
jgi:hypothetical protein